MRDPAGASGRDEDPIEGATRVWAAARWWRRATPGRHRGRRLGLLIVSILVSLGGLIDTSATSAQEAPVGLGTAGTFAVLAGSGVTNTGASTISGDLGGCPTPAVTGFPPGAVIDGTVHAGDAVCLQAQSDLTVAYNDAAGRAPTAVYPGVKDLGGETLPHGVYKADAFAITGDLTFDAQADPDAVWISRWGPPSSPRQTAVSC